MTQTQCKLGHHVTYLNPNDKLYYLKQHLTHSPYIKLQGMAASDEGLANTLLHHNPNTKIIARYYKAHQYFGDSPAAAKGAGRDYARDYFTLAPVRLGLVKYIETYNEAMSLKQLQTPEDVQKFIAHHEGFIEELQTLNETHKTQVEAIGLNLANGNLPGDIVGQLAPLFTKFTNFGVHLYGYPTLKQRSDLSLDYKRFIAQLRDAFGIDHPYRLFITECGVTTAVIWEGDNGWRNFLTPQEYIDDLWWFNSQLVEPELKAALVFDTGDPSFASHDTYPEIMELMLKTRWQLEEEAPTPPPPPPPSEDCDAIYRNGVYTGLHLAYERLEDLLLEYAKDAT